MRVTIDFSMCRLVRLGLTASIFAFSALVIADETPSARIPPTADELTKLSKRLLSEIEYLSPYWASKSLPPIALVTQDEINRVVCKKPCAVRAAYIPERGVLLSETLDPINEPLDRSILLHELVHYLQEINNRYSDMTPCKRWFQREHEAYAVQNQYLYRINANRHVGGMLEPSMCKDHPEEKKSTTFQTEEERSNLRY
jgi:hypothetical protein